jgi:hypothetical protein
MGHLPFADASGLRGSDRAQARLRIYAGNFGSTIVSVALLLKAETSIDHLETRRPRLPAAALAEAGSRVRWKTTMAAAARLHDSGTSHRSLDDLDVSPGI